MSQSISLNPNQEAPHNFGLYIGSARFRSKTLLARAWDHPELCGDGTALQKACLRNLNNVASLPTPSEVTIRDAFREAIRIAWFAWWLSCNYDQDYFSEKELDGCPHAANLIRQSQRNHKFYGINIANRSWLASHVPPFDRNGEYQEHISKKLRSELLQYINTETLNNLHGFVFVDIHSNNDTYIKTAHLYRSIICGDFDSICSFEQTLFLNQANFNKCYEYRSNYLCKRCLFLHKLTISHDHISNELIKETRLLSSIFLANVARGGVFKFDHDLIIESIEIKNCRYDKIIVSRQCLTINIHKLTSSEFYLSDTEIGSIAFNDINVSNFFCINTLINNVECIALKNNSFIFENTNIHDKAEFYELSSSSIMFKNCYTSGNLSLSGIFSLLLKNSSIHSLEIQNKSEIVRNFEIIECTLEGTLNASRCDFHGNVRVTKSEFNGLVTFFGSNFNSSLNFSSAEAVNSHNVFYDIAIFNGADDGSGYFNKVDFSNVHFLKNAEFNNRKFFGASSFDRSKWEGVPKFHNSTLNPDTSFREAMFVNPQLRTRKKRASTNLGRDAGEKLMFEYERAFRTLKLQMESLRAKQEESKFHRLELISRRLRGGEINTSERVASFLYDLFCGYGESFSSPLIYIFLMWSSFAGINLYTLRTLYFFKESLLFSMINLFRPFYVFNPSFERMAAQENSKYWRFVNELLQNDWFTFYVFSTIHSISGIILLFLTLLALRRRFQIQ